MKSSQWLRLYLTRLPCEGWLWSALDGRLYGSASFGPLVLWTLMLGTGIPCEKIMDLGESRTEVVGLVKEK